MAKQHVTGRARGLPIATMLMFAILGALVVGASFAVIRHWPLPVSVTPYMGFSGGFWWGLIVGAISGLVLGFLADENHFADT